MALTAEQQADLANLALQLSSNKETRKDFAKIVRKVAPERAGAFTDVQQQEDLEALREEIETKDRTREATALQRAQQDARQALITSGRYSEDEVKKIETEIMTPSGLNNYEHAAIIYASKNPPANPEPGNHPGNPAPTGTWEFPTPIIGGKAVPFLDFAKNPNAAARNCAFDVITEFKNGRRGRR